MKNFSFLILVFSFFIALPSYSIPNHEKNNFIKIRKRFERVDTNGDGLLSKDEMMSSQSDRIDKFLSTLMRMVIVNYQKKNYAYLGMN